MKGGGGIPLIAASAYNVMPATERAPPSRTASKHSRRVFHHPLYAGAQTPPRNAPAIYIAFYACHPKRNRTTESKGLVTFLRHLLLT